VCDLSLSFCIITVMSHPKIGIAKSEKTIIARQRLGKHIPAAANKQVTIE
jgi:hypothetical protein